MRRTSLRHRTIVAGIYLNARLVSLRIPKRFTIGYESAFGIRQSASLLQGASGQDAAFEGDPTGVCGQDAKRNG